MNGTKDFGAHGHATQAMAHTIQVEARLRHGAPRRRRPTLRYRIGKTLVVTGSKVMGRSVDVRDLAQPA
jgi:hypothetical protein